jgi:L-asparaginase
VAVVATGGTIGWDGSNQRMLSAAQLCADAGLTVGCTRDVAAEPSWNLSIEQMTTIAAAVGEEIDRESDAVVVTHGTDTMEETAWLTELLLGPRRATGAVIFTGATRFWDHPESDGPANLRAAAVAASSSVGSALGVQVLLAGRTHAARWARKVDAGALDSFESDNRPSTAPPPPLAPSVRLGSPVPVIKVGAFSPDALPDRVSGLVLEGTGAAHVPVRYLNQIQALADHGIPVVLATRCRDAPRLRGEPGLVLHAGDLTAEKAALALMVALGQDLGGTALQHWWEELIMAGHEGRPEGA